MSIAPATMEQSAYLVPMSSYDQKAECITDECTDEILLHALYYNRAEWAMEKLYTRYKRYVYTLAYHIVNESFLAEDVVQEVFLTLWHKAFAYHEDLGSVKSWLQTIVRNRAIDKMRSALQKNNQYLEDARSQDISSTEPELWEQAWASEQSTFIRRALTHLPMEQQVVIELSFFQGYTHMEIAEQQHIPLGTVKGRLRLGLQKIRLLLQEYGLSASM